MDTIRAIKGMLDISSEEVATWQFIEKTFAQIAAQYGYKETRFPIVESTNLFKRSIGEVTDIVEKEMYTFSDRNDGSLTLRPEGTACCARSLIQAGKVGERYQHKLWYAGPMFRYEKPQKGRQRQFHQIGMESFGFSDAQADAELLLLTHRLWKALGIADVVKLELNTIGTVDERNAYKAALQAFLQDKADLLDEDSKRRLNTNPLRILDSKIESTQALLVGAPVLTDFLGDETKAHFARLTGILDSAGLAYELNTSLVRGLDYYNYTVFEWTTTKLGAQGTVCAGGRYDKLVEQLGGKSTPGVGFAMGLERLVLLLESVNAEKVESLQSVPDACVVAVGDEAQLAAFKLLEHLRDVYPSKRFEMVLTGGSFKSQMKKVDKSGAEIALIIGESEASQSVVGVKWLRDREQAQQTLSYGAVVSLIKEL